MSKRQALKTGTWRVLGATAVLLLVAVAGTFVFFLTSGPEFTAELLSRLSGRTVRIEQVHVEFGASLHFELVDLRVYGTPDEEESGIPLLQVPRARVSQSWPHLFAGQFVPRELALTEPVLRLLPPAPEKEGANENEGFQVPANPGLAFLSIQNGSVEWQRPDGEVISARRIEVAARRSGLTSRLKGKATLELARGDEVAGRTAFEFEGTPGDLDIGADFIEIPLTAALPDSVIQEGTARGIGSFHVGSDHVRGFVDLRIPGFRAEIPQFHHELAPEDLHARFHLSYADGVLTVQPDDFRVDDLRITGDVAWRPGENGRVNGFLSLAPFEAGRPGGRLQVIRLMGLRFASWADIDRRIERGRIENFRLDFDLRTRGLEQAIEFGRRLTPRELSIRAEVKNGVYRPNPDSSPLENISTRLFVRGNVLEVQGLKMERDGKPLPEIDLTLDGMHRLVRLPQDERSTPKGPGTPIPGLGPAFSALKGNPDTPRSRIRLQDFRIDYTAFILPFRNVDGWLSAPNGGILLEEAEGVLGGVPARVRAFWDRANHAVEVAIEYLPGQAPEALPLEHENRWLSGIFAIERTSLAVWELTEVEGSLEATRERVRILDVKAKVGGGDLEMSGEVSLAQEGTAPLLLELELAEALAARVGEPLDLGEGKLSGLAGLTGQISAQLNPDRHFLEDAEIQMHLKLEKGTVGQLPATMALARLPSLQGARALFGQPLPYDNIESDLTIREGVLSTDNLELTGPELRMLAAGEMDLLSAAVDSDILVAILLLETVDRMIRGVPILGEWVLGDNGNLLAVYVSLKGPRDQLQASLLPPETIRKAGHITSEVLSDGVARMIRLLGFGEDDKGPGNETRKDEGP